MKRKLEDQLIRLSFGDLSKEEADRIRAEVRGDAEATRMLDELQGLKSDLRSLKDVPPDQLSTERLRHAILNQGLKPKKTMGPIVGWLWAPATVMLLVFSVSLMRLRLSEPRLPHVGGINAPAPRHNPVVTPSQGTQSTGDAAAQDDESFVDDSSSDYRPVARAHPSSSRIKRIEGAIQSGIPDKTDPGDDVAMTPSSPLVLIATDSDNDTGAKRATEVDSPTDVLISG